MTLCPVLRYTKVILLGADRQGLSCCEPEMYQKRFMQKMKEILLDEELDAIGTTVAYRSGTFNPITEEIDESRSSWDSSHANL